jgi:hypothetical protein
MHVFMLFYVEIVSLSVDDVVLCCTGRHGYDMQPCFDVIESFLEHVDAYQGLMICFSVSNLHGCRWIPH